MSEVIVGGLKLSTRFLTLTADGWQRRCRRCEILKVPNAEEFHLKWRKVGQILDRTCRECRELEANQSATERRCKGCGGVFPATREFFPCNRGVLLHKCKTCIAPYQLAATSRFQKTDKGRACHRLQAARAKCRKNNKPLDEAAYLTMQKSIKADTLCGCCGCPMEKGQGSIDCVIPSLGYAAGNMQVVCKRCNRIKNDGSLEDFRKIIAYIQRHS